MLRCLSQVVLNYTDISETSQQHTLRHVNMDTKMFARCVEPFVF